MQCEKCGKKISAFNAYYPDSSKYTKGICKDCYEYVKANPTREPEQIKKQTGNHVESKFAPFKSQGSGHKILMGIAGVILFLYVLAGIIGLIILSENPLFKDYLFVFGGMMLVGLIIPLELMAIYYKIKS